MKVAFLYGNLKRGGAQRVICCLANSFVRQGDEVSLVTLNDGCCEYMLDAGVQVKGLDTAGDSQNMLDSLRRLFRTLGRLRKWEREERPEVVVAFSQHLACQLRLALLGCPDRCRIVVSERSNPAKRDEGLGGRLEGKLVSKADGFIFQTERVKALFPERLQKIGTVIHNGLFSPDIPEKVTTFSQRNHKAICAVGRLDNDQKAYDVMFRAFALFHERHPEHVLNIFGRGIDEPVLRQLIAQLGLEDRIILHGNHPHVIHEIRDMGMFVMTSRYEGMPNALIEAMACGLPCVCTDCDFGPAELIRDGESGLLVPVDDVTAIAAAMGNIADDSELAEKLSRGALEIRQTHGREEICSQYRDYILSVIEKRKSE